MKKLFLVFLLVIISCTAVIGTDWNMYGGHSNQDSWDRINFTFPSSNHVLSTDCWSFTTPVVVGGVVYVGCTYDGGGFEQLYTGRLYKLNATDLSIILSVNLSTDTPIGSVIVVDDFIYVTYSFSFDLPISQFRTSDFSLVAENFISSGSFICREDTSSVISEGYLYYGCPNDNNPNFPTATLYVLNSSNVSQSIFNYTTNSSKIFLPTISENYIYLPTYDGVHQINKSNMNLTYFFSGGQGTVILEDPFAYMTGVGDLFQFNASNISVFVNRNFGISSSLPVYSQGYIYYSRVQGTPSLNNLLKVTALNITQINVSGDSSSSNYVPISVSNNLLYTLYNGTVYYKNLFSLNTLGNFSINGSITSSIAVVNNNVDNFVYMGASSGNFYLFSPNSSFVNFYLPTPSNNTFIFGNNFSINSVGTQFAGSFGNLSISMSHDGLPFSFSVVSFNGTDVSFTFENFTSDGYSVTLDGSGGSSLMNLSNIFSGLPLGRYSFNSTAVDVNGTSLFTDTRSVVVTNVQFVNFTEVSGSVLNRSNIVISAEALNISSTQLFNMTFHLFNSTSGLVYNSTVGGFSSDSIFASINITNVPNGLYFFNVTTFDMNNLSAYTDTRFVLINLSVVSCVESWVSHLGVCSGGQQLLYYSDDNSCGTFVDLPVDNNTFVSCPIVCSPSWVASFVPSSCNLGYHTKVYIDSMSCGVSTNLPFDNGTVSSCNIFSNISTNRSVKLFDYFTVLVGAPFNTSNVTVVLQYPNSSFAYFNTSWNGLSYETPLIYGYPNGSYSIVGVAGNQSILGSFVISDFEVVIPTQYNTISAGENYSILLEVFTDSLYSLNHSISCSVPDGFNCFVVPSLNVTYSGNTSIVITTNGSLPSGAYSGNLTVTRLLDGRVFSSVLNLGISSAFGVPQVDNPSSFTQVMFSNEVRSKEYIVRNVGSFNLSNCSVVVDGSFSGVSFVSGSNNFSLDVNESRSINVSYSLPSAGIYTGYFNVECVASPEGLINGLSNPQFHQLFVFQFVSPIVPPSAGGGGSSPIVVSYGNVSSFVLLNSAGSVNGYVSFSYPSEVFSKTFIVQSKVSDTLTLVPSCLGDFCQFVKFSKSSLSVAGFGSDFFVVTVNVPDNVALDGIFSYQVVLTDSSGESSALINQVHISSLSAWYSKFALITVDGDRGFWFSIGDFNVPKLLLYFLLVLVVDVVTVVVLPNDKFYVKNRVLILTFVSLIVFGLSAVIY